MATHDYNLANQDGASFRSDLNNALSAIVSNNSSSTAPATTFAHQIWVDTTANVIKQRNAANDAWIELWRIDGGFNAKTFSSNVTLNAQSDLRFADSDSSNWVAFQAPATVSSNVTWTLPASDGTSGQVIETNGSGVLSWADAGGVTDNITEGNTSAEVVDTGSNGHFKVVTEGTEALRVDSSQRHMFGTSSDLSSSARAIFAGKTSGNDGQIEIRRAGTTPTSGTTIGTIKFSDENAASGHYADITVVADDNSSSGSDLPGRIVFQTTSDGASAPTERMRITKDGQVRINLPSNTTSRNIGIVNIAGTIGWTFGNGVTSSARQFVVYDNEAGAARTIINSSGDFGFNSGFGSAGTAYGCRAWANIDQQSTQTIRGSGNISSISDQGTGRTRFNFSTSMPDSNFSVVLGSQGGNSTTVGENNCMITSGEYNKGTGGFETFSFDDGPQSYQDYDTVSVAVFR